MNRAAAILLVLVMAFAGCTTGGITVEKTILERVDSRLVSLKKELEEIDRRLYAIEKQRNVDSRESFDQRKVLNDRMENIRQEIESLVGTLQRTFGMPPMSRVPSRDEALRIRPLVEPSPTPGFPERQPR